MCRQLSHAQRRSFDRASPNLVKSEVECVMIRETGPKGAWIAQPQVRFSRPSRPALGGEDTPCDRRRIM